MVFNIAQLMSGTALRDWNPANDQLRETVMATRAGLRSALHDGPLTYNQLKEKFSGTNILTSLSQMVNNGQLNRSGTGGDAEYTLADLPGRGRPPKTATVRASKVNGSTARGEVLSNIAHLPRRGRPPKTANARVSKGNGSAGASGQVESTVAHLPQRGRPPKAASARAAKKGGGIRKAKRPRNSAGRKQRSATGHIEKTIADLLKRREAIDRAIAALEELARSLR